MFDIKARDAHRRRAAQHWAEHRDFKLTAARLLADRLLDFQERFKIAADIGAHAGEMAQAMAEIDRSPETLLSCESCPDFLEQIPDPKCLARDETLPLASGHFDLITSVCNLHHISDIPGSLLQIRQALRPDGLFLGCLVGGESLKTLRACFQEAELEMTGGVSPRISPMVDIRDLGGLLQRAGFVLPVCDSRSVDLTHGDAFACMADLRNLGEGNCLEARIKHPTRKSVIFRAAELYQTRATALNGRLITRIDLLFMHGRAPA